MWSWLRKLKHQKNINNNISNKERPIFTIKEPPKTQKESQKKIKAINKTEPKQRKKRKQTKTKNMKISKSIRAVGCLFLLFREVRFINSLFESQLIQVFHFADIPSCQ